MGIGNCTCCACNAIEVRAFGYMLGTPGYVSKGGGYSYAGIWPQGTQDWLDARSELEAYAYPADVESFDSGPTKPHHFMNYAGDYMSPTYYRKVVVLWQSLDYRNNPWSGLASLEVVLELDETLPYRLPVMSGYGGWTHARVSSGTGVLHELTIGEDGTVTETGSSSWDFNDHGCVVIGPDAIDGAVGRDNGAGASCSVNVTDGGFAYACSVPLENISESMSVTQTDPFTRADLVAELRALLDAVNLSARTWDGNALAYDNRHTLTVDHVVGEGRVAVLSSELMTGDPLVIQKLPTGSYAFHDGRFAVSLSKGRFREYDDACKEVQLWDPGTPATDTAYEVQPAEDGSPTYGAHFEAANGPNADIYYDDLDMLDDDWGVVTIYRYCAGMCESFPLACDCGGEVPP